MNGTDRTLRQLIEFFLTSGEIGVGVHCLYAMHHLAKGVNLRDNNRRERRVSQRKRKLKVKFE